MLKTRISETSDATLFGPIYFPQKKLASSRVPFLVLRPQSSVFLHHLSYVLLTCEPLLGLPLTDLMSSSCRLDRDQDSSPSWASASLLAREAAPAQDARDPGLWGKWLFREGTRDRHMETEGQTNRLRALNTKIRYV